MIGTFDYDKELIAHSSIDVDDIGNCSLLGYNDSYFEYGLIVKTSMGKTQVFSFGPFVPDVEILPDEVNCNYQKIDYNEKKIINIINMWLNDKKKKLTQVRSVELQECINSYKNIIEYL